MRPQHYPILSQTDNQSWPLLGVFVIFAISRQTLQIRLFRLSPDSVAAPCFVVTINIVIFDYAVNDYRPSDLWPSPLMFKTNLMREGHADPQWIGARDGLRWSGGLTDGENL